jgi:chorismate-pyruvate lyase
MTNMPVSVDPALAASTVAPLPPAVPPAAMWLAAGALNCYESDANLRSWLITPGLLTERIRAAAGNQFRMQVRHEGVLQGEHVREITMSCANDLWLFAHTRVPAITLETHPWLRQLGDTTLGEALATRQDLERTAPRYALLGPDAWVVERALALVNLSARNLWVRHSAFHLGRSPFDLYEIFLPGIGG